MQSEQVNDLFQALSKAQEEMPNAPMDGFNPHFKSKFATLKSIVNTSRSPLSKHGLCVTQTFDSQGDEDFVITTLGHSSGQFISSKCPIRSKDRSSQAYGSGVTYARRYALGAILGMVTDEDDDGEASMPRDKPLDEGQKKKIKELVKKVPENKHAEVKSWIKSKGYEGVLTIPQSLYQELGKKLNEMSQAEALPY